MYRLILRCIIVCRQNRNGNPFIVPQNIYILMGNLRFLSLVNNQEYISYIHFVLEMRQVMLAHTVNNFKDFIVGLKDQQERMEPCQVILSLRFINLWKQNINLFVFSCCKKTPACTCQKWVNIPVLNILEQQY